MHQPILIIFALLPSIIWLLFYLRQDAHPEPKKMILKIFFYGALAALPVIFIQMGLREIITELPVPPFLVLLIYVFVAVAFMEEFFKYLVFKDKALPSSEVDEPLDVMLYLIVAALGFAASENIGKFLTPEIYGLQIKEIVIKTGLVLISSTFLHALASGTLGYFLAMGFIGPKKRTMFIIIGFFLATFLHGLYNLSIIAVEGYLALLLPFIIIVCLALFTAWGFRKLQKMKGVCKIK